ncbi:PP2C family protein-serine/threonine phosphatase [Streptomyces sp. NPDC005708]|uniref:PP2C family protein-serine/threonine phosphatase n=1 Tax=Streptomyces sp. NPDC005708 TaxID=3154564 RepID=UPI0033D029F2
MTLTVRDPAQRIPRRVQELPRVRQGAKSFASLAHPGEPPRSQSVLKVALLLIATITLIDFHVPQSVHLGDLLITIPAITAWYASARATALVTITAMGALMAICLVHESVNPPQVAALIATSVAITTGRHLAERRQRKLVQVRAVAETAQRAILPPLPRRLGPLRLASVYLAAAEEACIGGDLYTAVRTATGTRLIIGDVRGKGLPAVGGAAHIIGTFRDAARRLATLPELAAYLDTCVRSNAAEEVEPGQSEDVFATAIILEIPDDEPVVRSVTCGHPPPVLLRANDVVTLETSQPAPPLGLGALTQTTYQLDTFNLRAKETLLLYTDGAIEARNADGIFYPLTKRLTPQNHRHPAALLDHVRGDLLNHVGGRLHDDAALIAIERQPG